MQLEYGVYHTHVNYELIVVAETPDMIDKHFYSFSYLWRRIVVKLAGEICLLTLKRYYCNLSQEVYRTDHYW